MRVLKVGQHPRRHCIIHEPTTADATTDSEVKSEQYCSHRAFFGSGALRTLLSALALALGQSAFHADSPRALKHLNPAPEIVKCARIKS
jgi:hypothetical protein